MGAAQILCTVPNGIPVHAMYAWLEVVGPTYG